MPAEVGTAWVTIRAITNKIAGDIKDGLDRGAADADVDAAGESVSKDFGTSLKKHLPDDTSDAVRDSFKKVGADIKPDLTKAGSTWSKHLGKGFFLEIDRDWAKQMDDGLKKLGQRVSKFKMPPLPALGIIGAPAIAGLAKVLSGYVVSLVGQIGYLGTALGGLGVAGGAAFAGIGISALTLMKGLKAATPTLEAFKKASKDINKPWLDLAETMQQIVFPALTNSMKTLSGMTGTMRPFTDRISTATAALITWGTALLTSQEHSKEIQTILAGSATIFETLVRVILRVADTLLPLLAAAMPMAQDFAASIEKMVAKWQDFIKTSAASGALTKTLQTWYDRGKLVAGALGDIVKGIGNILNIGAGESGSFFDTFDRFAQRFRDFTESTAGQNRIKDIFDKAQPVAHEVNMILRDIVKLLAEPLLGGDTGNAVAVMESFRVNLLPALAEIARALSAGMGDSLTTFAQSFAEFLKVAADTGFLGTMTTLLSKFLDVLTLLMKIPGFGEFVAMLLTMASALGILAHVLGPLLTLLGQGSLFEVLGGALAGLAGVLGLPVWGVLAIIAGAVFQIYLAFKYWDQISAWIDDVFGALSPLIKLFILTRLPLVAIVVAFRKWREIVAIVQSVAGAIARFVTAIPDALGAAAGAVRDFFTGLPGVIGRFAATVGRALWQWIVDAVPKVLGALLKIQLAIWGFLLSLPTRLLGAMAGAGVALWKWIWDALPMIAYGLGYLLGTIINWTVLLPVTLANLFINAAIALWQWIVDVVPVVATKLLDIGTTFASWAVTFISEIPGHLLGAAEAVWSWVTDAVTLAAGKLLEIATAVWTWATGFISEIPGHLLGAAEASVQWAGDAATQLGTKLGEYAIKFAGWASAFVSSIPGYFGGAATALVQTGKDIMEGLWTGISSLAKSIGEKAKKVVGNIIKGMADAVIPGSPSKLTTKIGRQIGQGLELGIMQTTPPAMRAASNLMSGVLGTLGGAPTIRLAAAAGANLTPAAVTAPPVYIVVKIGDQDITNIVDARVSESELSMAQALFVRR